MSSRSAPRDPKAAREAERYEHPIASRELIMRRLRRAGVPLRIEAVAGELAIDDEDAREALRRRLRAMCRDGQLMVDRRGRYVLVDKLDLLRGRVQVHKKGFGWLSPDDGSADVYLHERQLREVMDADRVLIRVTEERPDGKREGVVAEVIERAHETLTGRYEENGGVGLLEPANRRIQHEVLIAPEDRGGARPGEWVEARMTTWPHGFQPGRARVEQVLGMAVDHATRVQITLGAYDIPAEWPEEVEAEVARLPDRVREAETRHRVDLRELPLVTIDGEDAKDFDDAVYCERRKGGGWRLYVAIADVSHYVEPNAPLDREAGNRGNSVYFPAMVVPMLPEALSNELCSLRPRVDRLCMVCEMDIGPRGRLTDYRFYEGVMRSAARLTYDRVGRLLDHGALAVRDDDPELADREHELTELHALYRVLRKQREKRGAIDFETQETRIELDESGQIAAIRPVQRHDAHKIIEECMVSANVAAARFLEHYQLPGIFRVHGSPEARKLEDLQAFLGGIGLELAGGDDPQPSDLQALVEAIRDRPDRHVIETVILRSMNQAVYQPENEGHFGLALPAYTHFTSPIRRYADLLVHRAVRHVVRSRQRSDHVRRVRGRGGLAKKNIYPYRHDDLARIGEHISMSERRADYATRDLADWLKCEYMREHMGAVFDGTVATVTSFGLFVEVDDVYIQGLIHVTALPQDYYRHNAIDHSMEGEHTGGRFGLGDRVRVQLARVDVDQRQIDFLLEELLASRPRPGQKRGRRGPAVQRGAGKGGTEQGGTKGGRKGEGRSRTRKGGPRHTKRSGRDS